MTDIETISREQLEFEPKPIEKNGAIRRVITVTLNPAFDRTVILDGFEEERVNRILSERTDPGGKGVNVSRVLTTFGVENTAVVVAGQENVSLFRRLLLKDKVTGVFLMIDGSIRENTTFILPNDRLVKVDKAGAPITKQVLFQVDHAISEQMVDPAHTLVVFAGSLPPGIPPEVFVSFVAGLSERGIRIAVDTSSLTLQQLIACKPWVIKPNIHELREMTGRPLQERREIVAAAASIVRSGVENVIVSMGADGLLLVDHTQAVSVKTPKVKVKSTVGAGDSSLAGFVFAKTREMPNEKAAAVSAAFGTASVMVEGTNAPKKEDVNKLLHTVQVQRMTFTQPQQ